MGKISLLTFTRLLAKFGRSERGNIAVIFAISCVPLITFMGAAIDYSRAVHARSSMQAALDSTALMVSKDLSTGTITTSQINATAQAYFTALYTNRDANAVTVRATYTAGSGSNSSTVLVNGIRLDHDRFHEDRWFPDHEFQRQLNLGLGQQPAPRRAGARQYGLDE